MNFKPGDIILLKQKPYNWFRWLYTLVAQAFKFFLLRVGLIEAIDKYYHIVLAYDKYAVFTEEPPKARVRDIYKHTRFRVFRLKNPPSNLNDLLHQYCFRKFFVRFDYYKFWQLVLDAIFHTDKFSKDNRPQADVCAESVARFYKEVLGIPCSTEEPESSIPSDVNRYCSDHPEIFEMVRDD